MILASDGTTELFVLPCFDSVAELVQAYDVYFDHVMPLFKEEQEKRKLLHKSMAPKCMLIENVACVVDSDDDVPFITLPCGHSYHTSCLRENLEAGSLGFTVCSCSMRLFMWQVEGGGDERAVKAVVDATCPALQDDGKFANCSCPIPWDVLFDSNLFEENNEKAVRAWEDEVRAVLSDRSKQCRLSPRESSSRRRYFPVLARDARRLPYCRILQQTHPTLPAAHRARFVFRFVFDADVQSSFCFRCPGHWFEEHRPATCTHMLTWGASVFGGEAKVKGKDAEDEDMLSRMYIFRNSVGCPGWSSCVLLVVNIGQDVVSACKRRAGASTLLVVDRRIEHRTGAARDVASTSARFVSHRSRKASVRAARASSRKRPSVSRLLHGLTLYSFLRTNASSSKLPMACSRKSTSPQRAGLAFRAPFILCLGATELKARSLLPRARSSSRHVQPSHMP